MPRSDDFAHVVAEVRDVVARVPPGALTTYAAIGRELRVPARHVAYVLAHAGDDLPWHRVVADTGAMAAERAEEQRARLAADGVHELPPDLERRFVRVPRR